MTDFLRYPHYDSNPSFSDFESFGGWSHPAIKQYKDSTSLCGEWSVWNVVNMFAETYAMTVFARSWYRWELVSLKQLELSFFVLMTRVSFAVYFLQLHLSDFYFAKQFAV